MKQKKRVIKPTFQFCPQDTKMYFMRKMGYSNNFNWPTRACPSWPTLNEKTLGKIFGKLHYKASHAPSAVNAQWKNAEKRFSNRHFARRGSARFSNKYTADRWL